MGLRDTFAENLRRVRLDQGFSQEALADLVGIDRTYVSALERKRYAVSLDVLERIAAALEVAPWRLLVESREPSGPSEPRT